MNEYRLKESIDRRRAELPSKELLEICSQVVKSYTGNFGVIYKSIRRHLRFLYQSMAERRDYRSVPHLFTTSGVNLWAYFRTRPPLQIS
jgi:hypothetical protein